MVPQLWDAIELLELCFLYPLIGTWLVGCLVEGIIYRCFCKELISIIKIMIDKTRSEQERGIKKLKREEEGKIKKCLSVR